MKMVASIEVSSLYLMEMAYEREGWGGGTHIISLLQFTFALVGNKKYLA